VLAGAVLVGAAVFTGSAPVLPPTEGAGSKLVEFLTKTVFPKLMTPVGKALAGAAMLGGGAAHFMGGEKDACHDHHEELARENRETFVMAEDMRKTNAVMTIQAAHAGNQQAQEMMAQMQGRAC